MLEQLNEPRAFAMIVTAGVSFFSACLALFGVVYGARLGQNQANLKARFDSATADLNNMKFSAEEAHKLLSLKNEMSNRSSEAIYRELADLRDTASKLLGTLEALEQKVKFPEERIFEAILAAKRLSLFYIPNTSSHEDLNIQLEISILKLTGSDRPDATKHLAAMRMNIWKLVAEKTKELKLNDQHKEEAIMKIASSSSITS